MYYSLIGCFITVFLGWTVSYAIGASEGDLYDEKMLHPLALKISKWFPGSPRRYADKNVPEPNTANQNGKVPTVSYVVDKSDDADPPHGIYRTKL